MGNCIGAGRNSHQDRAAATTVKLAASVSHRMAFLFLAEPAKGFGVL
jgi:hypothetical protein